jgi:TRAP-type mannitol/chloroaromatic compound transport system substrate-binding protein
LFNDAAKQNRPKGESKMPRKRMLAMVLSLVVGILLTFNAGGVYAAAADKPIIWKAQAAYASGLSYYRHAAYFAEMVKAMSGGRLIIQMSTGGTVVPVFSEQEAVHRGSLDLSCSSSMYIRGKFPVGVLVGNSMAAMREQEFMTWLEYGGGYALWQEMYDEKKYNVVVLPTFCIAGIESLGWFRKPIRKLEDFKGMKFRTVGEWGEVIQKLGASVVSLPSGELYSGLERGVLDGVDMSHPSFDKGLGLYEICKYNIYPGIHQTSVPMEALVNKDKWNALPNDLKEIVKGALRMSTFRSMTETIKEDAEAVEFFKTKGVEIIKLSPDVVATFIKLINEVLDAHAKTDPLYAKILSSQRAFHEKWNKYEKLQSFE